MPKLIGGVLRIFEHPVPAALIAAAWYTLVAWRYGGLWRIHPYSYLNYLADAFVHGQLHLRVLPPTVKDLSLVDGRYYLYWPPLPALLLAPFVALFGIRFSDTIFTIGVAAANVAVVAVLLRVCAVRGVARLRREQRGLLVLFVALGTVHAALAPYGRVWYTAQIVGFGCVLLAYLAALRPATAGNCALLGSAIGAAFLTRNHLLLAGLWPAWYLLARTKGWKARQRLKLVAAGCTPVVASITLYALYNWARFGSPWEQGVRFHQMDDLFRADYERYGLFNLHYVPTNLFYQFVAYPFPLRSTSIMGGSLVLMSPLFLATLPAVVHGWRTWSVRFMAVTVCLVAAPILLLMGTGWAQWGPRYTLDFTVPLLVLTAVGIRRWPWWIVLLLTSISIIHYTFAVPIGYAG